MTNEMTSTITGGLGNPTAPEPGEQVMSHSAKWVNAGLSVLLLIVALSILEAVSRSGLVSILLVPPPSSIFTTLWGGLLAGIYWAPLLDSLGAGLAGFLIASLLGFTIGGLLASLPRLERIIFPYVVAFQSTPMIAIAPLIIIWVGFGIQSKIVVVAVVCFFPILVNTLQGLRLRDRDRQELAIALGASRWQVFRYIRLPGSMPYVFAGLHVSAIFALIGAIVAEFVGARGGIGTMMNEQRALFNVPGVFAILIILMIVGLTVNLLMKALEKRVTFWSREKN
ncbi:ABC transporter permease [Leifsonia kafniensis]|uniref:ABC transporter permease n=2 Tax=Leifsonia kafniensis TaxID=475957 RepID=A0ABP7KHE1_9MICO